MTLLLQVNAGASVPASQTPLNRALTAASDAWGGSAAKLGFSDHKPESTIPTITPSPALAAPPNCFCQTPVGPVRPSWSGVLVVSSLRFSSLATATTPGVWRSSAAWAAVNFAAKPLNATV
jgi:hypothetical protein